MAKDDYDVILYRLLVYLYAVMKHKIVYDDTTFKESVRKDVENDGYFTEILVMAQEEGLINGVRTVDAWCGESILLSGPEELKITAAGIRYLKEDGRMRKIGKALKEAADIIAKLADIIKPF